MCAFENSRKSRPWKFLPERSHPFQITPSERWPASVFARFGKSWVFHLLHFRFSPRCSVSTTGLTSSVRKNRSESDLAYPHKARRKTVVLQLGRILLAGCRTGFGGRTKTKPVG